MTLACRWMLKPVLAVAFAAGAVAVTGCQTYPAGFGGMTLPTAHYLKHYPQYFPPDPQFPLQRELQAMQDPSLAARPLVGGLSSVPGALPAPPNSLLPPVPVPGAAEFTPPQAVPPAGGVMGGLAP